MAGQQLLRQPCPPKGKKPDKSRPIPNRIVLFNNELASVHLPTCLISGDPINPEHQYTNASTLKCENPNIYNVRELHRWVETCKTNGWEVRFPVSRAPIHPEEQAKIRQCAIGLVNSVNLDFMPHREYNEYGYLIYNQDSVEDQVSHGLNHPEANVVSQATTGFYEQYYQTLEERLYETLPDNRPRLVNIIFRMLQRNVYDSMSPDGVRVELDDIRGKYACAEEPRRLEAFNTTARTALEMLRFQPDFISKVMTGGMNGKLTYKGRSYKLRTGKRGGKYILVKGQKKYVNSK